MTKENGILQILTLLLKAQQQKLAEKKFYFLK